MTKLSGDSKVIRETVLDSTTMSKKIWTINNGWYRKNICGQIVLCEIGPSDFDPDWEFHARNAAEGVSTAPYRQVAGARYVFKRKSDWQTAVDHLHNKGFIS